MNLYKFSMVTVIHNARGAALLELSIFIPVLFSIFLAAIEFTNYFGVREQTKLYSRLAADTAYRRCLSEENLDASQQTYPQALSSCIENVARDVWDSSNSLFADTRIAVSVYRLDAGSVAQVASVGWQQASTPDGEAFIPTLDAGTTRFSSAEVQADFSPALVHTDTLVIGEIISVKKPLIGLLSDRFYSVAVS